MREIEFHGKRKDNGEWVCGDLIHNIFDDRCAIYCQLSDEVLDIEKQFEVIPETVGEYTGIEDKNGVKIFEGDIILVRKEKYIVRFCQGEYLLDASGDDCPCKMRENGRLSGQNTYYLKVKGNIYDNQELLGRKKLKERRNTYDV